MQRTTLKYLFCLLFLASCLQAIAQPNITKVEYYIDTDPGFGNATNYTITVANNIANQNISIDLSTLSTGLHKLVIRAKDANGAWSNNNTWTFIKAFPNLAPAALPNITKVEYYIDADPGLGNATTVGITASTDISNIAINLDTALLTKGIHKLVIRAMDANGVWSLNNVWMFAKAFPSLANGTIPNLMQVEYYLDNADPGVGNATQIPFTAGTEINNLTVNANINGLDTGIHYIHIRAKDANGAWSHVNTLQFKLNTNLCAAVVAQNINLSGCNSVIYKGKSYTTSIIVKDTLKTLLGCDSVFATVNIDIDKNISGNIRHFTKGSIIANATVLLNNVSTGSIVSVGNYQLNCVPTASNGTIRLLKNNDVKKNNGISGIDVILTTNHILNKAKLNSPYKLIAADVNNNKTITNIDIIFMKRLILGIDTSFTGNRLWAFVDSAYTFPDTTNPFPYKDSISFTNLTSSKTNQTFIGVKLGDVNYDWNASLARGTSIDNLQLIIDNVSNPIPHSQYLIPFKVKNFKNLTALQYTLHFNNDLYEFVAIKNSKLEIEYNAAQANKNGSISFLWADSKGEEKTLVDGSDIFTLVLKPKDVRFTMYDVRFDLTNDITEIEAWDKDNQQHNIILSQKTKDQRPTTKDWFSVSPNPNDGNIIVSLLSNTNKKIMFELSNAVGKTLYTQAFEAVKGSNSFHINLNKNTKLPSGVYFIKAKGMEGDNVKRIVVGD